LSGGEDFVCERKNLKSMCCLILSQYKDLRAGLIWVECGALTTACGNVREDFGCVNGLVEY